MAGIEPASKNNQQSVSTCVVGFKEPTLKGARKRLHHTAFREAENSQFIPYFLGWLERFSSFSTFCFQGVDPQFLRLQEREEQTQHCRWRL